jgi:hypothetical protein
MRIAKSKPPPWSFGKKLRYSLHKQRRSYNSKHQTRYKPGSGCIRPECAPGRQHIERDRKSRGQDPVPTSPGRSMNPGISDKGAQEKSQINSAAAVAHGQGISQNPEHAFRGLMTDRGEAKINADRVDMKILRCQDWRRENQQAQDAPGYCHNGSRGSLIKANPFVHRLFQMHPSRKHGSGRPLYLKGNEFEIQDSRLPPAFDIDFKSRNSYSRSQKIFFRTPKWHPGKAMSERNVCITYKIL